jgi:hypothetical protein
MRKILLVGAGLLACGPAFGTELVTPPLEPYPYPQGVPTMIVGAGPPQPVITLAYGFVRGRRVLYDPTTGRIVYWLRPSR